MKTKYTNLKIFNFPEKLKSLPQHTSYIEPPIHIRIKPTNSCNHNCKYCAYRAKDLQLGQDMNIRDFIPKNKMNEIIEDIIDMGVKAVTFSGGGEPLLYPYIKETVTTLSNSPIKFACLTNGSLLSGEIAELFAINGTWVRVSIDGWDSESYASYRGCSVSMFSRVINNLKEFKKLNGKCVLGASIILDKNNSYHVVELIDKLVDTGIDNVKISACVVSNSGSENNKYHEGMYDKTKELIQTAIEKYTNSNFEIFDSYHKANADYTKNYHFCPYLQILPIIGADQRVYSCQDKAYNLSCGVLGSIENIRFKDFWFSDKNKFFMIDPSRDCHHHCVSNTKNLLLHEYFNVDDEHTVFV